MDPDLEFDSMRDKIKYTKMELSVCLYIYIYNLRVL